MDTTNILVHVTYGLIALSYLVRDMLWLRALAVAASICSIGWTSAAIAAGGGAAENLKVALAWNVVFLTINAARILLLLKERWSARLDELQVELWETIFPGLTRVEFNKLIRVADWRDEPEGATLARQGEPLGTLQLVYSGRCGVEVDGQLEAEVADGAFVGEMSFTTHQPASATVTCQTPTRVLAWPREALERLLERNPGLKVSLQGVLGVDMARKLASSSLRVKRTLPDDGDA